MAAHQVLVEHLPVKRRLGWRLKCACGGRYPCPAREAALNELEARVPRLWWLP
jgi:hypothetical protein